MISRINAFDRLYIHPQGNTLILVYSDRPGVLARITTDLAAAGINIEDIHAPHDQTGENSMAIIKTNTPVDPALVARLKAEIEAKVAFSCTIN